MSQSSLTQGLWYPKPACGFGEEKDDNINKYKTCPFASRLNAFIAKKLKLIGEGLHTSFFGVGYILLIARPPAQEHKRKRETFLFP